MTRALRFALRTLRVGALLWGGYLWGVTPDLTVVGPLGAGVDPSVLVGTARGVLLGGILLLAGSVGADLLGWNPPRWVRFLTEGVSGSVLVHWLSFGNPPGGVVMRVGPLRLVRTEVLTQKKDTWSGVYRDTLLEGCPPGVDPEGVRAGFTLEVDRVLTPEYLTHLDGADLTGAARTLAEGHLQRYLESLPRGDPTWWAWCTDGAHSLGEGVGSFAGLVVHSAGEVQSFANGLAPFVFVGTLFTALVGYTLTLPVSSTPVPPVSYRGLPISGTIQLFELTFNEKVELKLLGYPVDLGALYKKLESFFT